MKTQEKLYRKTRLNPGSCEVTEVSCETLREDAVLPSASSGFSVPKLHEQNTGKDVKNETNMQQQKEVNMEEIQESRSTVSGAEAYQIGDKATNNNPNHSAETQSSLPFNIQHPEPPQERGNKRSEGGLKVSNIEDIDAICHSSASDEPLDREEKRNSPRSKSSRLNPASFEVTKGVFESLHEDIIAPLAPSSSNVLIEQSKNEKQKPYEEQVTGRRSSVGRPLRRAAEKIVSYKEKPLNVKMRRA